MFDWLHRRLSSRRSLEERLADERSHERPSKPTLEIVPTPEVAPTPAADPAPPTAESGADSAAATITDGAAPGTTLEAGTLQSMISDRLFVLLDRLPEPYLETDAPAVLNALAGEVTTMIHQPPVAAQRTLAMSRKDTTSVGELVGFFESDPSLAQALLHHANSAYYGGHSGRMLSLAQAVQTVGMSGVENVVLSHMVHAMLCKPGSGFDTLVQKVWSHMVRCGPLARDLAHCFDVEPERGFTLALLHDAGKLIFFDRVSQVRKQLRRDVKLPDAVVSRALKRLHEPLGGLAALNWGFDESAVRAIATHHREPPPEPDDRLCGLIYLVEKMDLAATNHQPFDLETMWQTGRLDGDFEAVRSLLEEGQREAA